MKKNDIDVPDLNVYQSIRDVLAQARARVYSAVNSAMVEAYWEIGRQIEQAVGDRAEYGKGLLRDISEKLTVEFGKGFDERSLRRMRQFYQVFPIRATVRPELSWSHYRLLMKIDNAPKREFYLKECAESNWSVRQLERERMKHALFDYAALTDKDAEQAREDLVKTKGFFILPSELFENVRKRAVSDENLNETLENVFKDIEASAQGTDSEASFKGLFDDIDVNSNKLGNTVAKRNERLVKLMNGIADVALSPGRTCCGGRSPRLLRCGD
ncbi:MAG: DUF1016 N-terminal domain-containing protein [Chitinispirillales bacterium]|nr:DUF1016 N-terminal domain-containing protein [Chitinispirillales bacterium]